MFLVKCLQKNHNDTQNENKFFFCSNGKREKKTKRKKAVLVLFKCFFFRIKKNTEIKSELIVHCMIIVFYHLPWIIAQFNRIASVLDSSAFCKHIAIDGNWSKYQNQSFVLFLSCVKMSDKRKCTRWKPTRIIR